MQTNINKEVLEAFLSKLSDAITFVSLGLFVYMTSWPQVALAFDDQLQLSQSPLIFVRDASLKDSAVVGIEAFPQARTVGALFSNPTAKVSPKTVLKSGTVIRVLATAYSSTVDQTDGDPFTTASGKRVAPGIIAANFVPLGTEMRLGNTKYTVWDRMNSRYNDTYIIDIWFPTRAEAIAWGVRVVEVEITDLPTGNAKNGESWLARLLSFGS